MNTRNLRWSTVLVALWIGLHPVSAEPIYSPSPEVSRTVDDITKGTDAAVTGVDILVEATVGKDNKTVRKIKIGVDTLKLGWAVLTAKSDQALKAAVQIEARMQEDKGLGALAKVFGTALVGYGYDKGGEHKKAIENYATALGYAGFAVAATRLCRGRACAEITPDKWVDYLDDGAKLAKGAQLVKQKMAAAWNQNSRGSDSGPPDTAGWNPGRRGPTSTITKSEDSRNRGPQDTLDRQRAATAEKRRQDIQDILGGSKQFQQSGQLTGDGSRQDATRAGGETRKPTGDQQAALNTGAPLPGSAPQQQQAPSNNSPSGSPGSTPAAPGSNLPDAALRETVQPQRYIGQDFAEGGTQSLGKLLAGFEMSPQQRREHYTAQQMTSSEGWNFNPSKGVWENPKDPSQWRYPSSTACCDSDGRWVPGDAREAKGDSVYDLGKKKDGRFGGDRLAQPGPDKSDVQRNVFDNSQLRDNWNKLDSRTRDQVLRQLDPSMRDTFLRMLNPNQANSGGGPMGGGRLIAAAAGGGARSWDPGWNHVWKAGLGYVGYYTYDQQGNRTGVYFDPNCKAACQNGATFAPPGSNKSGPNNMQQPKGAQGFWRGGDGAAVAGSGGGGGGGAGTNKLVGGGQPQVVNLGNPTGPMNSVSFSMSNNQAAPLGMNAPKSGISGPSTGGSDTGFCPNCVTTARSALPPTSNAKATSSVASKQASPQLVVQQAVQQFKEQQSQKKYMPFQTGGPQATLQTGTQQISIQQTSAKPQVVTARTSTISVRTPTVRTPVVNVPQVRVPQVRTPVVNVPRVNVPQVRVPTVNVPRVNVPQVRIPTVRPPTVTIRIPGR